MAMIDLLDLVYEDNIKNTTKRKVMEIIISETDTIGVPVIEVLQKVQKEFGKKYGKKVFYNVMKRLKDLGIAKIKWQRDLETGKRYKVILLTPDVFEWRFRNKILRVIQK